MERAGVRFALRCKRETAIRAHRSAAFQKRCVTTRSNQRFAVAAARKSRARALNARTDNRSTHGARK
eukprot:2868397-Lingulodinium_polyedra.AAC.1